MPKAKPDKSKGGDNDLMRKFKEALDSKRTNGSDPKGSGTNGPGHAQDVHGQAEHKRVFRRKSG